ncbi:hypothetical protein EV06_1099 [Prochlorococcus sp. MIT 0602]|nr:hypothetical protein EV06_1099 [Prochlorococcus sp. MIT 0602]KGG17505.1 hypothetical protein EV07_0945 [Prochlorococcus sp. MIT 0603]
MNLEFIDVPMQDTNQYRKYRRILISKYPNKEGMGWPTYLIVEEPLADFKIIGEIKGGMSKGEFRENLNDIINTSNL